MQVEDTHGVDLAKIAVLHHITSLAHEYPREVNDVAKAVAWVRANAATYRIDPARIAVLGASSGNTLMVWSAW